MVYGGFSTIGRMHIQTGLPNQDAFRSAKIPEGYIAVVSDGLGSCRKSKIGSWLLVTSALYLASSHEIGHISVDDFAQKLTEIWEKRINRIGYPLYECCATALFAIYLKKKNAVWLGRLGDGAVTLLTKEIAITLSDTKEDGFINIVSGCLGSNNVSWNLYELKEANPKAAFLWTDGISDSIDKNEIQEIAIGLYEEYYQKNLQEIQLDCAKWVPELPGHDDKTIAYWLVGETGHE